LKNIDLNIKALSSLENTDIPNYNLENCCCQILHIGVGNFHRSHQAYYLHKLLKQNDSGWRICGAGLMPQDLTMKESLKKQDYLYTLVAQELDSEEVTVVGTIRDFIHISTEFSKFIKKFTSEELKIVSLTVTEKGYCNNTDWDLDVTNERIIHDLNNQEELPITAVGVLAKGLKARMMVDAKPITIMSCDNIPENGVVLKNVLLKFIELKGDLDLINYIKKSVVFPCCMVDRITPGTTEEKKLYLSSEYCINDNFPVFSEKYLQWVIEDKFNVVRPEWEKVGAQIVDDVKPYELMKTRLLNGGHTSLSFPSLLSGFVFVDDAMRDPKIKKFVKSYMNEVKTTLNPIVGVDYDEYIDQLIVRFANPATKDRILRLSEDTSSKFLNFIINPLMIHLNNQEKVPMITVVLASWIIYLAKSLTNLEYEVKDPIGEKLQKIANESLEDSSPFLSVREIFPKEILDDTSFVRELNITIKNILDNGISKVLDNL
jgi:mannitol 2-dehydrogenase